MKRFISILLIAVMLLCGMQTFIYAGSDHIIENPPVSVPLASPVIDGVINASEGWSQSAYLDRDTAAPTDPQHNEDEGYTGSNAKLYFAMNHEGFCFAADIVDGVYFDREIYKGERLYNDFLYSEETDWIDINVEGNTVRTYGWDGDVFGLMLDPAGMLLKNGYTAKNDRPPLYLVGLFKKGGARVYRENVMVGEITGEVSVSAKKTSTGWTVEGCIPWMVIIEDISVMTHGEIKLTSTDIINGGTVTRAAAVYVDRFMDLDAEERGTLNYFVTVPSVMADGTPGYMGTGDNVLSLGLTLISGAGEVGEHKCSWTAWERVMEPIDSDPGYDMSFCLGCGNARLKFVFQSEYKNTFKDVNTKAWYADEVEHCVRFGYMNGMSKYRFAPNGNLTREQFVVILANYAGVDTDEYKYTKSGMKDVATGKWYSGAVAWAVKEGYVSGVAPGKFGLGQDIQRAALARLLFLFADSMGMDTTGRADLMGYKDFKKVEPWMKDGLRWAIHEGLISSTSDSAKLLSPKSPATRAQTARIITMFDEYLYRQLGFEVYK